MMKFRDREEAGEKLAERLADYQNVKKGIILALPRGGVVVGAEISKELNLPLDIIVTRKIGAPFNPEYAIAAAGLNQVILNEKESIDQQYLKEQLQKERLEIQRRLKAYRGQRPEPKIKGRTIILVDDGLATGLTMQAAVSEVRRKNPAEIILAVPVAPPETLKKLEKLVDKTVVLKIEPVFFAIGQFYENFTQVSDQEVKDLLIGKS